MCFFLKTGRVSYTIDILYIYIFLTYGGRLDMARHGVIALATKHVPHKSFDPLNAGFLTSQVVNMFPRCFFCASATGRNASLCMTVRLLP